MCVAKLREVETFLKGRCQCCGGRKSKGRASWYCAKCQRALKSACRKAKKG